MFCFDFIFKETVTVETFIIVYLYLQNTINRISKLNFQLVLRSFYIVCALEYMYTEKRKQTKFFFFPAFVSHTKELFRES